MKFKVKKNNGITLIALIITIIVMLILVGVTITVAMQGGLFNAGREAANKTEIEADRETLQAAVVGALNIETGIIESEQRLLDNLPYGWSVEKADVYTCISPKQNAFTVDEKGNITYIGEDDIADLTLLRKYFIGDNIGQRDFLTLLEDPSTMVFKNDETSIADAKTSLSYLGMALESLYSIEDTMIANIYVKYNNKAYKVACYVNMATQNPNFMTQNIAFVYKPNGDEGKTVEYSYDGTETNKKSWTILYDNGSDKEIISPEVLGSITLGEHDPQAIGENNLEKAIDSYNNALKRINDYTVGLVTNSNKINVRNTGSNPTNPTYDTNQYYSSDKLEQWNSSYNGRGKLGDINCEQDFVRMIYWGVQNANGNYWLSSRVSDVFSTFTGDGSELLSKDVGFSVRYISDVNNMELQNLWNVYNTGEAHSTGASYGVRPVVKVSSDSI